MGGARKGWDKRRRKKVKLVKNQKQIQINNVCSTSMQRLVGLAGLRHHFVVPTVTEASSPQATPALQASKHGDGQVYKRNSNQNSLVFHSAPKQDNKMSSRAIDKEPQRSFRAYSVCLPCRMGPTLMKARRRSS